jgi:hypothetical protein
MLFGCLYRGPDMCFIFAPAWRYDEAKSSLLKTPKPLSRSLMPDAAGSNRAPHGGHNLGNEGGKTIGLGVAISIGLWWRFLRFRHVHRAARMAEEL